MKIVSASPVLLALTLLMGAQAGDTASWPQFRGPNRDDVSTETGLLKQWPAGGPKLLWKTTGIGKGYSSVSVAGGKIFTMGDLADGSYVLALDMSGQKILWSTKVGDVGKQDYPGTRGTPTVDGNLLYAEDEAGEISCLQTADGKEVWHKSFKKDLGAGETPHWGFAESLLVDGDLVICTPGGQKGTMMALNKKSGETVWRSEDAKDNAAYSSVIAADIDGVHQFIQLTPGSVFGVDAKTGKVLWYTKRRGATAVIPTPIYFDHYVFVASGYGVGCNCFKVSSAGGVFKVEEAYKNPDMVNHHGGVIRVGDYLYGFSDGGGWTCMEFKTGKVMWTDKEKGKSKGVGKGAITVADGMLYMRSEGGPGTIALAEASPEGYKEHGRFNQPDRSGLNSWPHPVVCDGKLYIRDQDVLLCYDVKNP